MKSLLQIIESEASTNAVAAVAMPDAPIFLSKRFGGWDEHVVPEDHYMTIRKGREKYARWATHLPDTGIQGAVKKSLYRDGTCLITNAKTNASILLKHAKTARARMANLDDSLTMAFESTEDEGDFTVFDENQIAELLLKEGTEYEFEEEDDPEYLDAYEFYANTKGDEIDADAFAQIVACFFDNVYSSDDESDTIDSLFNAAVTEVKAGSDSLGLTDVTQEIVWAAKKYIEDNYDITTATAIELDDGTEYDFDDNEITEGARLAELPTVNPEDVSKDDVEGWAIINLKDNKVVEKPKAGENQEHKSSWLKEYYGTAGVQSGLECAWINTKTGVVTKVKEGKSGKP